jgi:hypothetical protein
MFSLIVSFHKLEAPLTTLAEQIAQRFSIFQSHRIFPSTAVEMSVPSLISVLSSVANTRTMK